MRSVVVEWLDAHYEEALGSIQLAQTFEPMVIKSSGWLVVDDDKMVVLARDQYIGDSLRHFLIIPKACVIDVT